MTSSANRSWWRPAGATVVAGAMIACALVLAVRATAGLEWPCEMDFFRDMGGAQAILDGDFGADPAYLGEKNWFTPLQPAVFAALAKVTGLTLPTLYASWGPFVNLLGPVAFFLLAYALMGPLAGLAALAAYLFLGNPAVPSWFQATYSPWAWPMDFAQGFFYLTLAAYLRARATGRTVWDVITGALLGLTFLAHAAPTLVFVGMLFLLTIFTGQGKRARAVQRLITIGAVSLIVASPFLLPLIVKYRLHVVNHGPSEHEPIGLGFVLRNLLSFRAAVALIGLAVIAVYRGAARSSVDRSAVAFDKGRLGGILLAMLASASLLLGYGLGAQWLFHRDLLNLPRVLPTYHFHVYLKAVESLLFGVGFAAGVGLLVDCLRATRLAVPAFAAALALVLAMVVPHYANGVEFTQFRADAERIGGDSERIALYDWLRGRAKPTDVFATDMTTALLAVSAANRKVVCMGDQYSNIYVNYDERAGDLGRLFASLRAGDYPCFANVAAKYGVTHVILAKAASPEYQARPDNMTADRFALVFECGSYRVYVLK